MSKRVADKLRGHARVLEDFTLWRIRSGEGAEGTLTILEAVIANLRRDADDEEQRGKDWVKDPLRPYRLARERELEKLGIAEQKRKMTPPKREASL